LLTARLELYSEARGHGSDLLKNKEKRKKSKKKSKRKEKKRKQKTGKSKIIYIMECRYCTKNPCGEKG
jgi:hypothetical protein